VSFSVQFNLLLKKKVLMEFLLSGVAMIFIAGVFISFVVALGTLRVEEEAERRKSIREEVRKARDQAQGGVD
jgi:hypothetical protein